ncbi:hypothetical protein [Palleronia caenipelagi]|uniref:Uncharacterized protein n=1 Tax=Palleronia caenipelagi TaxID=2489174 RepID=A0A547Q6J0_9RHOB|nr:hypothetical protein [Palleronia caenipelagi]TRD21981.1 hypothetical protein FEV53_06290 [Palleronia caenipelagi]
MSKQSDTLSWTASSETLKDGVWTIRLEGDGDLPEVDVIHHGETLGQPDMTATEDGQMATFSMSDIKLSDGVQSVYLVERATGVALCSLHIAAGRAVDQDLVTEVAMLRDELDLLKRSIRRKAHNG